MTVFLLDLINVFNVINFFSAFLRDFSLLLDRLSGDGSLRRLTQPCCVALGQELLCMAVSRVDHRMHYTYAWFVGTPCALGIYP